VVAHLLVVLSWGGVVCILAAYASQRRRWYNRANALCCVPVALPALLVGAWAPGFLNLAFGLIGLVAWVRDKD